jgi:hypothetical protein
MQTPYRLGLGPALILFCGLASYLVSAQAPQSEPVLVVEGATLIDGNGGAPVPDSAIVIRGNRIASVARRPKSRSHWMPRPCAQWESSTWSYGTPSRFDPAVVSGMWGTGTSNVAHLIVNYRY